MGYPMIVTDLSKLKTNMDKIVAMCHSRGLTAGLVTKCVCADERVVGMMNMTDVDFIADSRVQNLARIKTSKPRYLLRIAQISEAAEVIEHSEISQQSEIATVAAIGREAVRQNKRHKVVIMVDMGDLREGVFFRDRDALLTLARAVAAEPMLELYGVAVNLTCFGGILPDGENLGGLVEAAEFLRRETGCEIPFVSGGNSSSLQMLLDGALPAGINNLRIGEGYLLGNETAGGERMGGFNYDCFTLYAELIELKKKPSKPIGTSGMNAFGEAVSFDDRGDMLRGILAVGRQDVTTSGLTPLDKGVEILGSSSDHLIVDLTHAEKTFAVGDKIAFNVDYGALLHAFTGGYIMKEYVL